MSENNTNNWFITECEKKAPSKIDLSESGQAPWSLSKIKVLQQCPLKYYLQYLVKVKMPAPPPTLVTTVGKAVHGILEEVMNGKSIGDSFAKVKREYVEGRLLTPEEWVNEVATTEMNIIEFKTKMDDFEKKHPIKRVICEKKLGITQDLFPTEFFSEDVYWRGVIDLGIQLESNDVIILDHKTGAPADFGIRNFKSQLNTYKILFHLGFERIAGAQAGIHFVKDGKTMLDDYVEGPQIEKKLFQELKFYANGSIDKTKSLGYFKHIAGPYCNWCDYRKECKAGNLKNIEDGTKRYFNEADKD